MFIHCLDGEMLRIAAYLLKIKATFSKIAVATTKNHPWTQHAHYLKLFTKTGIAAGIYLSLNNHPLK